MQVLFNGLISGCGIALLATAFQIVYLPTRVFFLGLAGIFSFSPYVVLAVQKKGEGLPVALAASLAASVALCFVCEWANHGRLARKGASEAVQLVASLGSYMVIVQGVAYVWGSQPNVLVFGTDSTSTVGRLTVTTGQWIVGAVSIVLLAAILLLLRFTGLGLRLRALADNPAHFALQGFDLSRHRLAAFALAGFLGASASLITAKDVGFDPYVGLHALLLAIVAVYIGGASTFVGPIVGALALGVIRGLVAWNLEARWQEAVTFSLLAVFLIVRPQGILGKRTRLEAAA